MYRKFSAMCPESFARTGSFPAIRCPMKLSIPTRLFLAVLVACAVVLAVNSVAERFSFERVFLQYLNEQGEQRMQELAGVVSGEYRRHGSWDFMRDDPETWFWEHVLPALDGLDAAARRSAVAEGVAASSLSALEPPLSDQAGALLRMALMDEQGQLLVGNPAATTSRGTRLPIRVDGHTVGWLSMLPLEKAVERNDVRFYEAQQRARWLNIAASIAVAALLAWGLSRALLSRLKLLASGIRHLAHGEYDRRLPAGADDEFGRLLGDVNHLAQVLERTEHSRRDFMADISHELRTPLAVLRAGLEAMQDGIRPMNAEGLQLAQAQVQQLGKLVDDLHELSMAQSGAALQLARVDVGAVLDDTLQAMAPRLAEAGLALEWQRGAEPLPVSADDARLQQVFSNLLENAARYTDRGGRVRVGAGVQQGQVRIIIEDTAPGVPEEQRTRLFERFYRVDRSRARARGGSGLGLSICQYLVQAHRGTISASGSPLGGLRITITLPLQS